MMRRWMPNQSRHHLQTRLVGRQRARWRRCEPRLHALKAPLSSAWETFCKGGTTSAPKFRRVLAAPAAMGLWQRQRPHRGEKREVLQPGMKKMAAARSRLRYARRRWKARGRPLRRVAKVATTRSRPRCAPRGAACLWDRGALTTPAISARLVPAAGRVPMPTRVWPRSDPPPSASSARLAAVSGRRLGPA